jgi:hypothetical protein
MSALYDTDMDQDVPELVFEPVVTLKNIRTGETLRVRLKKDLKDRYVIGSVRKDVHWVAPRMKNEWRIAELSPQARAALAILSSGLVVAIGAIGILLANR